jgi:hypothetical protein
VRHARSASSSSSDYASYVLLLGWRCNTLKHIWQRNTSDNISNPELHDANNRVVDSVVRSVGKEWLGTCGIIAFYSRGTRVLHNEVAHVPYTGVSIGWGWTQTMEVTCESRLLHISRRYCLSARVQG